MRQRINKMIVLVILSLLFVGKSSAMGYLKDVGGKALQLYRENRAGVTGVAGFVSGVGGAGLLCAAKNVFLKKSSAPEGEKFVPLKPGEIAILEENVRKRLGLDDKKELPKNVVDALINMGEKGAYKRGFSEGLKECSKKNGDVIEKLNKLFGDQEGYPKNWYEKIREDYDDLHAFLNGGHEEVKQDSILYTLYCRSDYLGIMTAKEVFGDKTDDVPEDESFETYLKAQLDLLSQRHKEEIEIEKDALKLLVAKVFVKDYLGEAPPDIDSWTTNQLNANFTPKKKKQKKSLFGRKKGKK